MVCQFVLLHSAQWYQNLLVKLLLGFMLKKYINIYVRYIWYLMIIYFVKKY